MLAVDDRAHEEPATSALAKHVLTEPTGVDVQGALPEQPLDLRQPFDDVAALHGLSRRPRDPTRWSRTPREVADGGRRQTRARCAARDERREEQADADHAAHREVIPAPP